MEVQNKVEYKKIQTEIPEWQTKEIAKCFDAYTKIPDSRIQFDIALEILYKYVNHEN